jgi:hypothetical protein
MTFLINNNEGYVYIPYEPIYVTSEYATYLEPTDRGIETADDTEEIRIFSVSSAAKCG